MKKILSYLKLLFVLFALALFLVLVGFNVYQRVEIDRLNQIFEKTRSNLNMEVADKEFTIQNLQDSFNKLNAEVEGLRSKNKELNAEIDNLKSSALARIIGNVIGFVSEGGFLQNQSQLVCAQNAKNDLINFCVTANTISKNFEILVPPGSYIVFSKIFEGKKTTGDKTGIYNSYVKCFIESKNEKVCERNQSTVQPVVLELKSGDVIKNVDPVDWL
ncbi:hypothetical protein D6810_01310 [Candidatus Dojkabacteria bacterium]|uniref:Uncharacterized protein n=1 Tax=Candidatus Dojkabacteria bacterium TaxID=2099670 RepID=A0A3M0Z594_9BACT|nr:MAG: hypothetical protein D6810_01310 [Candidatus Dojkabacteria bacterium]